jgi:ribosomal protein S18 acetylase RimI-like enzyme
MNQALIEDEHSDNPMTASDLETRMRDWLAGSWTALMIMSDDNAVAGYILFQEQQDEYFPDRPHVYVRQFYIRGKYRRRGIGKTAFEQIVNDWFPPKTVISLDVLAKNPGGYQFWTRLGFEVYSTNLRRVQPKGSAL